MDKQETQRRILKALADVVPEADVRSMDEKRSFRDQLEVDSVDFLSFMMKLESEFAVRIPEADYPRLSSLEGCLSYLEAQREAG
jgi:acyl carrier protein